MRVELDGEVQLLRLARKRFFGGKVREFDQLLVDCARALAEGLRLQIGENRAEDAHKVEAVVLVKAQILRREERAAHGDGHLIE